jgi:hypothetical protein
MKKLLLTGIAALFLATGTAQANDQLPEQMLGRWCEASLRSDIRTLYFRPSLVGREHCVDFNDGITLSQSGFTNDLPTDTCYEYIFDKVERIQDDTYYITAHCEKVGQDYNPEEDNLGGTHQLQLIRDDLLIASKMPEG